MFEDDDVNSTDTATVIPAVPEEEGDKAEDFTPSADTEAVAEEDNKEKAEDDEDDDDADGTKEEEPEAGDTASVEE